MLHKTHHKPIIILMIIGFIISDTFGQLGLNIEYLSPMPEPVTNNAVCSIEIEGEHYIYSFAGIDSTLECGTAHLKTFKYHLATDEWTQLADIPDPLGGKVAAAASVVGNKIYIIGGYHISNNCEENSSRKIHIFDPVTDQFLEDGDDLPLSLDDQVQFVYRDSLIYTVTGWSNITNTTRVLTYDPALDDWSSATIVPNDPDYRVFGASGELIGNTIIYSGGATFTCNNINCFSSTQVLRKGVINPEDPLDIEWSSWEEINAVGYRMGASTYEGNYLWIGGSDVTYNFDAIDYNGSGIVEPNQRVSFYSEEENEWQIIEDAIDPIMDIRGVAKLSENEFLICGGISENAEVLKSVLKITVENDPLSNDVFDENKTFIYPTISRNIITIENPTEQDWLIVNQNGTLIKQAISINREFDVSNLQSGMYYLKSANSSHIFPFFKI